MKGGVLSTFRVFPQSPVDSGLSAQILCGNKMSVRTWTCVIRWSGLLALAILLCEQSAQASCGSYVLMQGQHATDEHLPDVPCHGPNCQSNQLPVDPISPSAPPIRMESEQWAFVFTPSSAPSLAATRSFADLPIYCSAEILGGIFRPPR